MFLKDFVGARLRKRKDADLKEALKEIEEGDVSDLVREGLRMVLKDKLAQKTKNSTLDKLRWNLPTK